VGTGSGLSGRCAERLERARDRAARKAAVFGAGRVEAWARERAAPGDPTAVHLVDVIELRVTEGDALQFLVQVEPEDAALGADPASAVGWAPGAPPEALGEMNGQRRRAHGWQGLLAARPGTAAAVLRVFETTFQRAVDDCLAMAATARAEGRR
jgi:hypothetical protein